MNSFDEFSGSAKVWIYQCDRILTDSETQRLLSLGRAFVAQWKSHGAPVKGAIDILFDRFVVLVAEDNGEIGGCSIDSSVALIRKFQDELNADLLGRMNLAYLADGEARAVHISELTHLIRSGEITADSLVFDNTVVDLATYRERWIIPLSRSWAWNRVEATFC